MTKHITPEVIPHNLFLQWADNTVQAINDLTIPHALIPTHLKSEEKTPKGIDNICTDIRLIFNSLTKNNMRAKKIELTNVILQKATSVQLLEIGATEILHNFLVNSENIALYLELFDCVTKACISMPETLFRANMGSFFLQKCKKLIFQMIEEESIRKLASLDLDNLDDLDMYCRERSKISNLITTICYLYLRRNTSQLHLATINIYNLMFVIYRLHQKKVVALSQLGDPFTQCINEEEYEVCRKMINLYAEQLYVFMKQAGTHLANDRTIVQETHTVTEIVCLFRNNVIPTITENYLVSLCNSLVFDP